MAWMEWYEGLWKPSWTPAPSTIGLIWQLIYTRSRLPVVLEYQEEQPSQSMALKRELALKALSRKAKEALIQSVNE